VIRYATNTALFVRPYVLVLMAVDRSVSALVPARSMTRLAALIAVVVGTIVICLANLPTALNYVTIQKQHLGAGPVRILCINQRLPSLARSVSFRVRHLLIVLILLAIYDVAILYIRITLFVIVSDSGLLFRHFST